MVDVRKVRMAVPQWLMTVLVNMGLAAICHTTISSLAPCLG